MGFKKTDLLELEINPFKMIGSDWYLITGGNKITDYNTMTASWGSFGEMWGKHIFTCGIRPNRNTFNYVDNNEYFSLSFFNENYREVLKFCGSHSGRDYDKAKETGITPVMLEGAVTFEEADMVFICRKMYGRNLDEKLFTDDSASKYYENDPYHKMFMSEIISVYVKE